MKTAEASPLRTMTAAHARQASEVLESLGSTRALGLHPTTVADLRRQCGPNELAAAPSEPVWKKLLGQFTEAVVLILIVAAIVSGALGEWADALAIVAIVIVNGVLGFLQEERAEKALAALEKLAAPTAKVIRDGVLNTVPARELVPGDVIDLEPGDSVPADARLLEAFDLRVQEAALTGESVPVEKHAAIVDAKAALGDRRNMVHAGTMVAAGKATAVVVATGMRTELGAIVGLVQAHEVEPTPLQKRLAELGRVLVILCGVVVAVIFGLQLVRGAKLLDAFLLGVSLVVAAVPEGLPAIVTVALAIGLQRMVKRNALIRKLPSVETLGSVDVICTDKTGTLTRNEMTVRAVYAGGAWFTVSGEGFTPLGSFFKRPPTPHDETVEPPRVVIGGPLGAPGDGSAASEKAIDPDGEPDLVETLLAGAWCNNAHVLPAANGTWRAVGDPTEGALIVVAMKARIRGANDAKDSKGKLTEIPFTSERKAMSVVVRAAGDVMYTKGAAEVVLAKCASELRGGRPVPLTDERRAAIVNAASTMAARALRVLGIAVRRDPVARDGTYLETDLVFAGLVGMIDPPREEAKEAVRKCRLAGIRPVMITGDHPATALAIARELGIASRQDEVLTGAELAGLTDAALSERVEMVSVFARVSAEHKLRVVSAWRKRGHIVAMTGDGVNDAPALRAADVGIAMGASGTDAAKEASALVLADDNFASIVGAVEEGRRVFESIEKAVLYLMSFGAGALLLITFAALSGWPAPLVTIQILWMNMVTSSLPALAFSMEPLDADTMRRRPRPAREPIISLRRGLSMLFVGALIAGASAFGFWSIFKGDPENLVRARTIAFCIMVHSSLLCALSCRSYRKPLWEIGLFGNPYLLAAVAISMLLQLSIIALPFARPVFAAHDHTVLEWIFLFGVAVAPATVLELGKVVWRSLDGTTK